MSNDILLTVLTVQKDTEKISYEKQCSLDNEKAIYLESNKNTFIQPKNLYQIYKKSIKSYESS